MSLASWRVLPMTVGNGPWNMAVDEALLRLAAEGSCGPTLRFYGWSPACVSIGVRQPLSVVDRGVVTARGWSLVRRLTGGRGILHADEVTYALVAPLSHPGLDGGIMAAYRRISSGLLAGLRELGLEGAEAVRRSPRSGGDAVESANCFVAPSSYEITVGGRKLLGSAQTRSGGWLLQHGSLLRSFGATDWASVFPPSDGEPRDVAALVTSLDELMRPVPGDAVVAGALAAGLEEALGVRLEVGQLQLRERAAAEQLLRDKYGSPAWLTRVNESSS